MKRFSLSALAVISFTAGSRAFAAASLDAISMDETRVVLQLSAPVQYKAELDPKALRIVIDLAATRVGLKRTSAPKGPFVRRVTAEAAQGKARVIIDLRKSAAFDASWQDSALIVWLGDFGSDAAAATPSPAPAQPERASPPPTPAKRRYMVRVASFRTEKKASDFKDTLDLDPSLPPLVISPKQVSGKTFYQVLIGPFDKRETAKEVAGEFADMGRKAIVIRAKEDLP